MKMNIFTFLLHKVNSGFYFLRKKTGLENVLNFNREEYDSDDKEIKKKLRLFFIPRSRG